ncbi:MAG: cold shock domain-containing protein [Candidatus Nanosalina sp.]
MEGTVKFFHDKKQYGFIEVEDEEDDVFFHISNVEGEEEPEEGAEVTFEEEEGEKGPEAVDVTLA